MISLVVFMAALLIFIGLFSQTIQTSVVYQRHRVLSTKTSDLLDTMLLNSGLPASWGKNDSAPALLGFQDPEFTQYKLSSFSFMRLTTPTQQTVYYPRTGNYYSNLSAGFGSCVLSPITTSVNYSTASKLLGINGVYGFQLTVSPTLTVSITKTSTGNPLNLYVNVAGTGYPLAYASISYSLLLVNQDENNYPSYTTISRTDSTGSDGSVSLSFPGINGESQAYALIVYAYLDGLNGMGYFVHEQDSFGQTIVPIVNSFENRTILLAHSDSVGEPPQHPSYSQLNYSASFAILTEDYTLRQIQLNQPSTIGKVVYDGGSEPDFASVTVPDNYGILIVTFKGAVSGQYGIILMPWGLSSLGYQVTFGGNPAGQEWVTTDIRQVTIGGIAYHAKLALWNMQGNQGAS
jgi:hypothetical protein